jgi:hypothetical protein
MTANDYWNFYTPPAAPPPKRKRHVLRWILLGLTAVVIAIAAATCAAGAKAVSDLSETHSIVYDVTGSVPGASVDYTADSSGNQEQQDVTLPWASHSIPMQSWSPSVIAQAKGTGSITCQVKDDGKVISTHTSRGADVVVTC